VTGLLDELAVEQIADNLLSNAVKYGAGEPIEVSLVGDCRKARLTARDHGIGISEEDRARIFGAFERAVTRREEGGFSFWPLGSPPSCGCHAIQKSPLHQPLFWSTGTS